MINTKLQVLENELREKDKLFEDMYRVAFNANQGCKPPATMASTADNSMHLAPQVFFPSQTADLAGQLQMKMSPRGSSLTSHFK